MRVYSGKGADVKHAKLLVICGACGLLITVNVALMLLFKSANARDPGDAAIMARSGATELPQQLPEAAPVQTPVPGAALTPAGSAQVPGLNRRETFLSTMRDLHASPAMLAVVGLDRQHSTRDERFKALREAWGQLSADDVKAVLAFLDLRVNDQDPDNPLRGVSFNGLKNDLMVLLLRQEDRQLHKELGFAMLRMFRDPENDETWRDYCVQFFADYYQDRWTHEGAPAELNPAEEAARQEMVSAYWDAVSEVDTGIAGTALLAMERVSRSDSRLNREQVAKTAVTLAAGDKTASSTRIAALQVCASMQRLEALPACRMYTQIGVTAPLRMAAVSSLASLGQAQDVILVEALLTDPDPGVQRIAKTSLDRLRKRLNNG